MKNKQKSGKSTTSVRRPVKGFTDEEKSAMQQRVKELQTDTAEGEGAVLAKIAEMPESDRAMAERLHAVIKASLPTLSPRLWYGMPAYAKAGKDGRMICFFQSGQKFKTRYATFGFSDAAHLDEGAMWPNAYALTEVTPAVEAKIVALVKKAVS